MYDSISFTSSLGNKFTLHIPKTKFELDISVEVSEEYFFSIIRML